MKICFRILPLCLLLLMACQPEDVLSKRDMTALLTDMYRADGCIEAAADSRAMWDSIDVYGPLLEAHGVTAEHFYVSVDYYLRHPSDFVKIYKNVQKRLEEGSVIDDRDLEEVEMDMDEPEGPEEAVWEVTEGSEPAIEKAEPAEKPAAKPQKRGRNNRKRLTKEEMKELEKQLEK